MVARPGHLGGLEPLEDCAPPQVRHCSLLGYLPNECSQYRPTWPTPVRSQAVPIAAGFPRSISHQMPALFGCYAKSSPCSNTCSPLFDRSNFSTLATTDGRDSLHGTNIAGRCQDSCRGGKSTNGLIPSNGKLLGAKSSGIRSSIIVGGRTQHGSPYCQRRAASMIPRAPVHRWIR